MGANRVGNVPHGLTEREFSPPVAQADDREADEHPEAEKGYLPPPRSLAKAC